MVSSTFPFLSIQKKIEIGYNQRSLDFLKVFDWLMEACQNLCLSKDTFYTAVSITSKFYSRQVNQMNGTKLIEIQVGSIMSLAAKLQSNKLNYPEAISLVCGFNKMDIIDNEIVIMKELGFKVPLIKVQTEIIQMSNKWHNFLIENSRIIKLNCQSLCFGQDQSVKNWSDIGKQNYSYLCSFFDMIALPLYKTLHFDQVSSISYFLLQALFMLVNCKNQDFFPSSTSQKTYTLLVFENFLKQRIGYTPQEYVTWISDLIKIEQKLGLIEKMYRYLPNSAQKKLENKEDIFLQSNTRSCQEALEQVSFSKQMYNKIILEQKKLI